MNNLKIELFRDYFLSIRRGVSGGRLSNAKPIFILSLLSYVELISENKVLFEDRRLHRIYQKLAFEYNQTNISPFLLPFFHLGSAPFYELVWKSEMPKDNQFHTPSAKFLRENLCHAKLDDELWRLLKDTDNRAYLCNCIIEAYLK